MPEKTASDAGLEGGDGAAVRLLGAAQMIDLHSHILWGIDDGARDLATSLEMARRFADQGVTHVACTPHILPGLYQNTGPQIRAAVAALQTEIIQEGIPLTLVAGADNHIVPGFAAGLRDGRLLTLDDSKYVLVEPPHHVAPARMEDMFFELLLAGYIPILTHPERLTWIEKQYDRVLTLAARGVWMQVTSGSVRGAFGRRPKYWAERMLGEGLVHILASDAHNTTTRRPDLWDGFQAAERLVGKEEAWHLVAIRPWGILNRLNPTEQPALPSAAVGRAQSGGRNAQSDSVGNSPGGNFAQRLRRFFG
ncbi:MAG: CpsB/CapC family capsule biosynthesis tyrosine phosphatase [Hyphomicrobiaceae bacterium]